MLGPVGNLIVFVTDMERAKRFYAGVLGFETVMDYPEWVQFAAQAGQPKLCLHGCDEPRTRLPTDDGPRVQISFEVAGVKDAKRALEAKGVRFAGGIDVVAPGRALAKFHDPDGNELAIAGPP